MNPEKIRFKRNIKKQTVSNIDNNNRVPIQQKDFWRIMRHWRLE